ncbi:MAG: alpha/beta hydrolase, partial [Burkholderiales bacterium]|nr:alpha/beta hydrolase [Opitutaceae bacterium]
MKPSFAILFAAAALTFTGCAQYASVSEKKPRFQPVRATAGALASVERGITNAMRREKSDPLAALGELLVAADTAARQLALNPDDTDARDAYNFAVARVFSVIRERKIDPWTEPLRVPTPDGGEFALTHRPDSRKNWNPALYDFTPTDQFDIEGTYVKHRTTREGVGAPLVAVGRELNADAKAEFSIPRIYYGVTALIHFEGGRAVVALEDPLSTERVEIGGNTAPLAADFTAPIAVMLASTDTKRQELARLFRPEKYAETARISRLQPYDPNKTVVLVIHGLKDTQATWTPMFNTLCGDEEIRRDYQFWFFGYPTGYPYPYSAAILRRELDAIQKKFPLHKPMVVVGHSMGGCISRLLITDTEEKLWLALFKKPPAEVPLSPASREFFTEAFIFRPRPEVGRVVFMAAPLRGAELASGWPGRVGSRLVRTPTTLLEVGADAMKVVTFQGDELRVKNIPNSVDTLAPNNRFVRAVQTLPFAPGIPYHVIVGDRGKGGNKDKTKPVMSDGFVPYWSSRLDGAASELIVPSGHGVHQNAAAIAEVKR